MSITSGSPPFRARTAGTVSRFIGAETGVARLVEVSMVKVVDMATGNEVQIEKFPIALCRCGQSATKPFCDGAHSRCGFDGTLP